MEGKVQEHWGKLTEDDLEKIKRQSEQFLGLLQQRYGYEREKAEEEYRRYTKNYSRAFATNRTGQTDARR